MTPLERALQRRDAERRQRRASAWQIVLRRPRPPLPRQDGIEALYQLVQPTLGYYPRVDECRGTVLLVGDEEGRGIVVDEGNTEGNPRDGYWRTSYATSVGLPAVGFTLSLEDENYATSSADALLGEKLVFQFSSDEPWAAQQRWWQLITGAFERLGYEDLTLADTLVIDLFKTLRALGEIGPLMQFIAIATRHAFDQVAAQDGHFWLDLRYRPYIDHDKALRSITRVDAVTNITLGQNDMTRVPDALSRFPSLKELYILDNPLSPSERARLQSLVPAGCQIK